MADKSEQQKPPEKHEGTQAKPGVPTPKELSTPTAGDTKVAAKPAAEPTHLDMTSNIFGGIDSARHGDKTRGSDATVNTREVTSAREFVKQVDQGIADVKAGKHVTFQIDGKAELKDEKGERILILDEHGKQKVENGKQVWQTQANALYDEFAKSAPGRDYNFGKSGAPVDVARPERDSRLSTTENPITVKSDTTAKNADGKPQALPRDTVFSNGAEAADGNIKSVDGKTPVYAKTPVMLKEEQRVTAADGNEVTLPKGTTFWNGDKITLSSGATLDSGKVSAKDKALYAHTPDGQMVKLTDDKGKSVELGAGATEPEHVVQMTGKNSSTVSVNDKALDRGAEVGPGKEMPNVLIREGKPDNPMNALDTYGNSDATLHGNNDKRLDGKWEPKPLQRDHFDLWNNADVSVKMGSGEETSLGTDHYFMRSGYGNHEDGLLKNYKGVPANEDGSFDIKSSERILRAFDEHHAAPPDAIVKAVGDYYSQHPDVKPPEYLTETLKRYHQEADAAAVAAPREVAAPAAGESAEARTMRLQLESRPGYDKFDPATQEAMQEATRELAAHRPRNAAEAREAIARARRESSDSRSRRGLIALTPQAVEFLAGVFGL